MRRSNTKSGRDRPRVTHQKRARKNENENEEHTRAMELKAVVTGRPAQKSLNKGAQSRTQTRAPVEAESTTEAEFS